MKISKKIIFALLSIALLLSTNIFAATVSTEKATLELIENNTYTVNITDTAIFQKRIIDFNAKNKELTIELKVINNAIAPLNRPSEIVLLIDNSLSMQDEISIGGTRMEAVSSSAKVLATELLKLDTVKLSVVSFSTTTGKEATIEDAQLRCSLTNNQESILDAITEVENDATGAQTDIEAGLTLAEAQFTGTCESQFIILLTDGVPNVSLGDFHLSYSGDNAINTKNALLRLNNNNIQVLSMMTGVTTSTAPGTTSTYKELAEEVFGTPTNPTVGKFYYITDDKIEETVSTTILNQLIAPDDDILENINIYDYFPQEIVDNFNFSYVTAPTMGTISEDIDLQNNCILWNIDKLGYEESATVSYKLSLKNTVNEEILNVILKTNKEVDITSDSLLNEDNSLKHVTLLDSPKVRVNLDNTIAKTPVPQTGTTIIIYVLIIISVIACIILGIRFYKKNKDMKQ